MNNDAQAWLANEVREHLVDFGPMGLYELIWTLNGSSFRLSPEQARTLSQRVAASVLRDGMAELRTITWPGHKITSERLPVSKLYEEAAWHEGDQFVALVPPGGS